MTVSPIFHKIHLYFNYKNRQDRSLDHDDLMIFNKRKRYFHVETCLLPTLSSGIFEALYLQLLKLAVESFWLLWLVYEGNKKAHPEGFEPPTPSSED